MPDDAPVARTLEELHSLLSANGVERAFRLAATTNATGELDSGIIFNLESGGVNYGVRFSSAEVARPAVFHLLSAIETLHFDDMAVVFGLRVLLFHAAASCPDPQHCLC